MIETIQPPADVVEDVLNPGAPYFEAMITWDSPERYQVHFVCNQCGIILDGAPCPEHGPNNVPGMVKVVCPTGRHHYWVVAGDYYDGPCYPCMYTEATRPAPCTHRAWRRWRLTWKAGLHLLPSRIAGVGISYGGPDHYGCVEFHPHWRRRSS
jgi:hypothetical protein